MSANWLSVACVFLGAAVVAVPVAKRLGLGAVLGYLLAGVAIGPHGMALVGQAMEASPGGVMEVAEFGVVMMLFLVGLELRPAHLWELRGPILGLGGLQVLATTLLLAISALVIGQGWGTALAIGMALSLSSTALVIQSLSERGLLRTEAGRSSFSVLLFQDLAVIPILAILPILGRGQAHGESGHSGAHGSSWVAGLPPWAQAGAILGAVLLVVLLGRHLLRPFLRFIARAQLREAFTAAALFLVVGTALLMQGVGLSPALGTFLAGVVLAESEFARQLEADIEPFKGLLLGLFFIGVGANMDLQLVAEAPLRLLGFTVAAMAIKVLVLALAGRLFRLDNSQAIRFGIALAQGSEFAFVVLAFAVSNGVLEPAIAAQLVAGVALSMALSPLLFMLDDRWIQPRFARSAEPVTRPGPIAGEHKSPVILCGMGRFGVTVLRLLKANNLSATVLDIDPKQMSMLERFGHQSYYGDGAREDLLRAAGAEHAKLLIVAAGNEEKTNQIVRTAQEHFPKLKLLVRARNLQHAQELIQMGVHIVERETFGSALELGFSALRELGMRGYRARRALHLFRAHEERVIRELLPLRGKEEEYLQLARRRADELVELLRVDAAGIDRSGESAFDTTSLRREFETQQSTAPLPSEA
jgi:monovalent cation:proton antiporter-2 (CPA2) family protein